jgi:hypothetical protein
VDKKKQVKDLGLLIIFVIYTKEIKLEKQVLEKHVRSFGLPPSTAVFPHLQTGELHWIS